MTPARRQRASAWIGRYLKSNEDDVSDSIMWDGHEEDGDQTEAEAQAEQELLEDVRALAEEFAELKEVE